MRSLVPALVVALLATSAQAEPSLEGPDGEPLSEDGEVIFAEETAESIRAEDEDAPVSPLPEPTPDPDKPPDAPLHPQHRIEYNSLFGVRYNAIGLVERFDLYYRYRLYDDPGPLWRDADIGIGIVPWVSPAFVRIGPMLEIRPLTILTLQAGYFANVFFGTFNQLQGFDRVSDEYDDDTLVERTEAELANSTYGGEFQLTGQLLLKVGNVVVRDTASVFVANNKLPDGQTLFYDQTNDIMRSNGQPTISNDLDVVYLTDFSLIAGMRFNATTHLYADRDFAPDESREQRNSPTMRIGPLVAYRFGDVNPNFRTPTVLLLTNWWLRHRYRTGAQQTPLLPNISAAFVFKGDVWNSDVGLVTGDDDPQEDASIPTFRGL